MGKVKIQYRPFPYCPLKTSRSVKIGDNWDHISPAHFTLIAEQIIKGKVAHPNRALANIFHVPEKIIYLLHPFQQYTLMDELSKPLQGEPTPRNYLPVIPVSEKGRSPHNRIPIQLVGPSDRLSNISFGQFIYADSYFMSYGTTGNKTLFDKHMASLFHPIPVVERSRNHSPASADLQSALIFEPQKISTIQSLISLLPEETKIAWQYNYILLRHNFESRYTFVFPKVEEELEKDPNTDRNKSDQTPNVFQNWMSVYDQFVGNDIINSERYFNKNASEVLNYLNNKIRDSYKANAH